MYSRNAMAEKSNIYEVFGQDHLYHLHENFYDLRNENILKARGYECFQK